MKPRERIDRLTKAASDQKGCMEGHLKEQIEQLAEVARSGKLLEGIGAETDPIPEDSNPESDGETLGLLPFHALLVMRCILLLKLNPISMWSDRLPHI